MQLLCHPGGLSADDMAELVSGDPSAICGEAPAGVSLQPLQGDAFSWKFQVPVGADTKDSYELQTTALGLHRASWPQEFSVRDGKVNELEGIKGVERPRFWSDAGSNCFVEIFRPLRY